jgi:hypothetical protein
MAYSSGFVYHMVLTLWNLSSLSPTVFDHERHCSHHSNYGSYCSTFSYHFCPEYGSLFQCERDHKLISCIVAGLWFWDPISVGVGGSDHLAVILAVLLLGYIEGPVAN